LLVSRKCQNGIAVCTVSPNKVYIISAEKMAGLHCCVYC